MSKDAKKKNQCLLILFAVTTLEQLLAVCFSTQTLTHGQAGSFMPLGVWSMDSLTPAVCKAINGFFMWARSLAVIPARSQSQKKRRHRLLGKHEWIASRAVREGSPRWGWQLKCCGHSRLEVCLQGEFTTWQLTAASLACHPPDAPRKWGYLA